MLGDILMADGYKYTIVDGFDKIIEEKGNEILALRKIKWGEREKINLDLRRWYTNESGESIGKGTSFMTDNGPGELINVLIQEGYGETPEILKNLAPRKDFMPSISDVLGDTITSEQLERLRLM
jgi:hypothetical protein